ncbi:glycosyltransferase family 2 protein [Myxosarcina sp. GI1(2024)]
MQNTKVTLVVVPRERFSYTQKSLESIYQNTKFPFNLIYVDVNSPPQIKRYLEMQAQEKSFRLIRVNSFLTPNQSRNRALPSVDTEYVVFIDNDVLVKPGWLESLVKCADETGAWMVGPLCLEGEDFAKVHMAGGTYEFKQRDGKRWMIMRRPYFRTPLFKVRTDFQRQPCDVNEFHCCLTRMDVFEQFGSFDEQFMNVGIQDDFCLTLLKAGKPVYFEPTSVMSYVPPTRLVLSDIPFFFTHWSQAWFDKSINRLQEKWNITENSPVIKGNKVFLKGQKYSICPKPQEKFFNIKALLLLGNLLQKQSHSL